MKVKIDHTSQEGVSGSSGYTAWYSYAKLLSSYRYIYWLFNLLACCILGYLYWGDGEGMHQSLMVSTLGLILLGSTVNLFTDSSFPLSKYGSEPEAKKLVNYNFYITSLVSGLWGTLILVVIFYKGGIDNSLLACMVILMALNIPRAAISRAVYYIQSMLITLPAVFFLFLMGNFQLGGLLLLVALSIGAGINAIIILLHVYQSHELEMMSQIKEGRQNALLSGAEFDTMLKIEWQRATREHQYLSVIRIDLGDAQAHFVSMVAASIRSIARRAADSIGYLENEAAFKILLPNTSPEHALVIAERVQRKIQKGLLELKGSVSDAHDDDAYINVGVAGCRPGRPEPKTEENENAATESGTTLYPAILLNAMNEAVEAARQMGHNTVHMQKV